jgi:hypothetical protein
LFGGFSGFSANSSFVPPRNTNYSGSVALISGSGAIDLDQPQPPLISKGGAAFPIPDTLLTGSLTSGSVGYESVSCSNNSSGPRVQQLIALGNQSWESGDKIVGSQGYTVLDNYAVIKSSDGATQVTAYVLGDKNNCGQIVIAAAGNKTGLPQVSGWSKDNLLADQSFVRGYPTFELANAVQNEAELVQEIANKYPTAQISLTGVSEGGGISEIVGYFAHLQTVTFMAPGSGKLLNSFNDNKTLTALGAISVKTPANRIINYRMYGDQLSLVGDPVGTQITVTPDTATATQCPLVTRGRCALQQAVDDVGAGLLSPQNLPTLTLLIHNGHLLEEALVPASPTPGDFGTWNATWVSWYDLDGTIFSLRVPVSAHFYETLEPGPNYVPALLPILNDLVLAFNVANSGSAESILFDAAVPGGRPVLIDPSAGYLYSLSQSSGSPSLSSIVLPTLDVAGSDNVGWHLTYYTQTGLSGTLTSYTGEFDFPPGVGTIDFYAIDSSGNAIPFNDSLLFAATFSSSGQFYATLTTYLTPTTNLPLTSGQSCNGTFNGNFSGNVTVSAGQSCMFVNDCQIAGNVTVVGGNFFLACAVTGNVSEIGGNLELAPSASVGGNVQNSQTSTLTIDPGAVIGRNLQIQSISSGLPLNTVCGAQIGGNLQVQNNASPIEIGGTTQQNCAGNTVGGDLLVDANTAAVSIDYNTIAGALHVDDDSATTDVSGNSVGKDLECQGDNAVTNTALNKVHGKNQGQCAASP